jgi:DNA-binding CsgD family transcriptional regulator
MTRLPDTHSPFPLPSSDGVTATSPGDFRAVERTSTDVGITWRQSITPREGEILDRLARGLLYAEIGRELGIRTPTVKNHLHRIYAKIEVRSRTEAVVKWLGR